jgi:hypothetical protein
MMRVTSSIPPQRLVILCSPLPGASVERDTLSATIREKFGATTNVEAASTLFNIALQFELIALMRFVSLILENAV